MILTRFLRITGKSLPWRQLGDALVIDIPPALAEHKPCRQAFAVKIQAES